MSDFNGILNVKRAIAKAIDMDVMYVTDAFVDGNEVVFTVMMNDRFAADWKDGIVPPDSVQHIKSYEALEDIPF